MTARIFPSDTFGAGAPEAGVADYVENCLTGWESTRRDVVAEGLQALDAAARERHGAGFAELAEADRDTLLGEAERGALDGPVALSTVFQQLVLWTRQGMFCDPLYGGNRDRVGWELLGLPAFPIDASTP